MKKSITVLCGGLMALTMSVNCYGLAERTEVQGIKITSESLNIRSGPGLEYAVTGQAQFGEMLPVLGLENGWYLICAANGSYGMVYSAFTEAVSFEAAEMVQGSAEVSAPTDTEVFFSLTNEARTKNGLTAFSWDEELNEIALKKCEDMIENKYFGHDSPVYGTPFKMLKEFGIEYNGATENVAKGASAEEVYGEIMASPAHRGNVLNARYNRMGVAVVEYNKYFRLVVQIFVQM